MYLKYMDSKNKKPIFRKIKRNNKLFYLKLKLMNIKQPNIAKQFNKYKKTKKNLIIIYLIAILQIRLNLIEKKK